MWNALQQQCIPVGCVLSVSGAGGCPGGCLPRGVYVCAWGWACLSRGVSTSVGVSAWEGCVSEHAPLRNDSCNSQNGTQSSFPLIQPSFVNSTQFAQFEKKNQSCLAVHGTGDCSRHKWYRNLFGLSGRASDFCSTPIKVLVSG